MADLKPNTEYTILKTTEKDFKVGKNYTTNIIAELTDDGGFPWSCPPVELREVVKTEGLSSPEFGWTEGDIEVDESEGQYFKVGEPTGGPSSYYDMPFKEWITTNDQIEYLSEHKWDRYSCSFKDIFKALVRWGDKSGVDLDYDAKKIIYYGARVLRQMAGTEGLRKYLTELLEDKQFGG